MLYILLFLSFFLHFFYFLIFFPLPLLFDLANGRHKRNKVNLLSFLAADRCQFIFAYFQASN